jgi:hypothetical protein
MDKQRKSEAIFTRCTGQSIESSFSPTNSKARKQLLKARFQKLQVAHENCLKLENHFHWKGFIHSSSNKLLLMTKYGPHFILWF